MLVRVDEPRVDDDAVGVGEGELAAERDGAVGLDPQPPSHLRSDDAHLVHRADPLGDDETRLLLDLAGEPLEQLLALLDHAARRAPVVAAVAASVLHEQQAVGRSR